MSISEKHLRTLEDLHKYKKTVFINGDKLDISFQSILLEVTNDHLLLKNTISAKYINKFLASDVFSFQGAMMRFNSKTIDSDGVNIIFPIEENNMIDDSRRSQRKTFMPNEKVECEILNPFDGTTITTKPIIDISDSGASFQTNFASHLYDNDVWLPKITIKVDNKLYTEKSGKIIYTKKLFTFDKRLHIQVGVEFDNQDPLQFNKQLAEETKV